MARKVLRLFAWSGVILLTLLVAGGLYVRSIWQEWKVEQAIQQFDWQGVSLSLGGIHAEAFSLVRSDGVQQFSVRGEGFSLGWSVWNLVLSNVQIDRLQVDVPSWPAAQRAADASQGLSLPQLPGWLPGRIDIRNVSANLPSDIQVYGHLVFSLAPNPEQWRFETDEIWFEAPLPDTDRAGWAFRSVSAKLGFSGSAGTEAFALDVLPDSVLRAHRLLGPDGGEDVWLEQLTAKAGSLRLEAAYNLTDRSLQTLAVSGPLILAAGTLHHPDLRPQSWSFKGQMEGGLSQVDLTGVVAGEAGVRSDVSVRWPLDGVPVVSAALAMDGAKAGNAFAGTLAQWPPGLEVSEGQLNMQADLHLSGTMLVAEAKIGAKGMSGILDRMAWTGLNGELDVEYDEKVVVRTSDLKLEQLNPGIALGPLIASGRYAAPRETPFAGILSLIKARAGFLGGEVRVKPGEWAVSDLPARVPVWLNNVQVGRLMEVYPAEGLSGTGTLEGEIPMLVSKQGIQVAGGVVSAVSPGGTLRLPADRLRVLVQNNDTMNLVVRALQNFNYELLRSTIDYDQDGTLSLGLRLEGSNPEVRDGYPIVVNLNLQEDIPALLTSLQLSGRVNEAVTEKVRNLMKKREAGKAGQ